MGSAFSSDQRAAFPKSFYLIIGPPPLVFTRGPHRGPTMCYVDVPHDAGAEQVEQLDTIQSHVNISTKNAVFLQQIVYGAVTAGYSLSFVIDSILPNNTPPVTIDVYVGVKVEYKKGRGIVLSEANRMATSDDADADDDGDDAHETSSIGSTTGSSSSSKKSKKNKKSKNKDKTKGKNDNVTVAAAGSQPQFHVCHDEGSIVGECSGQTYRCHDPLLVHFLDAGPATNAEVNAPKSLKYCPIAIKLTYEISPLLEPVSIPEAATSASQQHQHEEQHKQRVEDDVVVEDLGGSVLTPRDEHKHGNVTATAAASSGGGTNEKRSKHERQRYEFYTFCSFDKRTLDRHKEQAKKANASSPDGQEDAPRLACPIRKQVLVCPDGDAYELEDIFDLQGDDDATLSPGIERGENTAAGDLMPMMSNVEFDAAGGGATAASSPEFSPAQVTNANANSSFATATADKQQQQQGGFREEIETDSGDACVICLTNPKNTTVLPCRHMCLCSECARAYEYQKCPICRAPVERLATLSVRKK